MSPPQHVPHDGHTQKTQEEEHLSTPSKHAPLLPPCHSAGGELSWKDEPAAAASSSPPAPPSPAAATALGEQPAPRSPATATALGEQS